MTYHFLSITQMTTKAAAGFALFALALLTCSCADSVDSSGFEQGGPGIIIPGNSIEGIQLGDSRERVEELLGVNRDVGLADGPYRAWWTFNYEDGLSVMFIELPEGKLGPVDALRASERYGGKTPEGVGIGSTAAEVRAAYGAPDEQVGAIEQSINYTYCHSNGRSTTIGIREGVVFSIFIGYYVPFDDDGADPCR